MMAAPEIDPNAAAARAAVYIAPDIGTAVVVETGTDTGHHEQPLAAFRAQVRLPGMEAGEAIERNDK